MGREEESHNHYHTKSVQNGVIFTCSVYVFSLLSVLSYLPLSIDVRVERGGMGISSSLSASEAAAASAEGRWRMEGH
jgi:hypothetical protein